MDLDQLKDIWQGLGEPAPGQREKNDILSMLKRRSNGPISKMKRNLLWELVLVVITYSAFIIHYFVSFDQQLQSVAWFLLIIAGLFLVYYFRKNRLLNEMQHVSGQVKVHLERQVITLEKYVRFYLIAGSALVPICLAFYGWIFYHEIADRPSESLFFTSDSNPLWKAIFAWLALAGVLTTVVYFANVWLLNRLYGNHIRKLKAILKEISEE